MIAFFTAIGFGASVSLLRVGGPAVLLFFVLSTGMAVAQNVIGIVASYALGQHPLMGVLAGSVTLTGGPATGLAFAPQFEEAGVPAAATLAVAAAMAGIVGGGLIGGPVATRLITRLRLTDGPVGPRGARGLASAVVENTLGEELQTAPAGEDVESYALLKSLVLILTAMWIGSGVSLWINSLDLNGNGESDITLPAYIGAMLVAAIIRNLDDGTRMIGISQRTINDLGGTALSLFLVMALMTLRLWDLVGVAVPLAILLLLQIIAIAMVAATIVHRAMGRDYESAVMAGGFCGFMLGTTANAMANMEALVERYGPAPKAFLVVPMVGAFFVDFTNAIIITFCLNILSV
ncbi:MAG TPA: sodium/glutamate symporter [Vicinamibacterales bacterium]|nr:sodium/glutamate symporter [Vicinamibacterales bacterium]